MGLLDKLFGVIAEEAIASAPVVLDLGVSAAKVAFHIDRFTRALEQCEKPGKREELRRNLAYWTAMQRAADLKPE